MADKKSQRLARIVAIQRQKEKMAEMDLAATLRLQAETDHQMNAVLDAMGSFDPIHMVISGHYSKNLGTLNGRSQKLKTHRDIHEQKMMEEKVKADRMEDKAKHAKQLEMREEEDESLEDLMDILNFNSD